MGIGFNASTQKEKAEELAAQIRVADEEMNDLQTKLRREIKTVKEMRANIHLMQDQVKYIEQETVKKRKLLQTALALTSVQNFNVEEVEALMQEGHQHYINIARGLAVLNDEVTRYIVHDVHELFTSHESEADEIRALGKMAQQIEAAVRVITGEINGHRENEEAMHNRLEVRRSTEVKESEKRPIGF